MKMMLKKYIYNQWPTGITSDRDRVDCELERLRIEKATIEKILLSSLWKNTESSELKNDNPIK